jgi:hypothetical protein
VLGFQLDFHRYDVNVRSEVALNFKYTHIQPYSFVSALVGVNECTAKYQTFDFNSIFRFQGCPGPACSACPYFCSKWERFPPHIQPYSFVSALVESMPLWNRTSVRVSCSCILFLNSINYRSTSIRVRQCFFFYSCSKWDLATVVYIWREPLPLATKVAWEPEEKRKNTVRVVI